jgi:hypothetical protein
MPARGHEETTGTIIQEGNELLGEDLAEVPLVVLAGGSFGGLVVEEKEPLREKDVEIALACAGVVWCRVWSLDGERNRR